MVCQSRPYHFKVFEDCLPQMLIGPFLNTFSHIPLRHLGSPLKLPPIFLTHFQPVIHFYTPLKTENGKFSNIFRGYISRKNISWKWFKNYISVLNRNFFAKALQNFLDVIYTSV